jgi:transcription initiation factor TFIID TATA-box-binding protein
MDDPSESTRVFARALIASLLASTREMFEDDQMEAELPYLERLFLEKVEATLRAQPVKQEPVKQEPVKQEESSVVVPAAPAFAVKAEGADGEDGAAVAPAEPPAAVDRMLHPSGIVPRIDNVMSNGNLGCAVDLRAFAERVGNVVYEPKRHAALSLYLRRPRGTIQLYASGKAVCTGCRSEADARACMRKLAKLARRVGCKAHLAAFRVTNIFGACDADFDIKLAHLASAYNIEYNPERSSKLTWHQSNPSVVLEITSKGHVGLSGTTRTQELSTAFEQVFPLLKAFSMPKMRDAPAPLPVPTQPAVPQLAIGLAGPTPALPQQLSAVAVGLSPPDVLGAGRSSRSQAQPPAP